MTLNSNRIRVGSALSGLAFFLGLLADFQNTATNLVAFLPFLGALLPLISLSGATFFGFWFLAMSWSSFWERSKHRRIVKENQAYSAHEDALNMMRTLQEKFEYDRSRGSFFSRCGNEEEKTSVQILMQELERIGLAPPPDTATAKWHDHLSRLMPYVRTYGVEKAKEERNRWYDVDNG